MMVMVTKQKEIFFFLIVKKNDCWDDFKIEIKKDAAEKFQQNIVYNRVLEWLKTGVFKNNQEFYMHQDDSYT
jgi:hypothetical protein